MKCRKLISILTLGIAVILLTTSCGLRLPRLRNPNAPKVSNAPTTNSTAEPTAIPVKEKPFIELRKAFSKNEDSSYMKSLDSYTSSMFGQKMTGKCYIEGDGKNKNLHMKSDEESQGITYTYNYYVKDNKVFMSEPGYDKYIIKDYSSETELDEILFGPNSTGFDDKEVFGDIKDEKNPLFSEDTVKITGEETIRINDADVKTSVYKLTLPEDIRQKFIDKAIIQSFLVGDVDYTQEQKDFLKKITDTMKVKKLEFLFNLSDDGNIVRSILNVTVEFDSIELMSEYNSTEISISNTSDYYDYNIPVQINYPVFTESNTISWADYLEEQNSGSGA